MKIGITIGDPGGIGPEIVLKAIHGRFADAHHLTVFGPKAVLSHPAFEPYIPLPNYVEWVDTGGISDVFVTGQPDATNGRAIESMLTTANAWAMAGDIDVLVTAPISKTSLRLAGSQFTGHTTMLEKLSGAERVSMGFYSPRLAVVLATIHHPLMSVTRLLTPQRLETSILHAHQFANWLGHPTAKIAMAGLNPHAGEGGLFGHEEAELLEPVLHKMKAEGWAVTGPLSPDTVFRRAYDGEFDVVVALYHDQGLIPIKLLAFEESVNVTIGLPYIRVSPDHGTAYDIAYDNKASEKSLIAAAELGIRLAASRSN